MTKEVEPHGVQRASTTRRNPCGSLACVGDASEQQWKWTVQQLWAKSVNLFVQDVEIFRTLFPRGRLMIRSQSSSCFFFKLSPCMHGSRTVVFYVCSFNFCWVREDVIHRPIKRGHTNFLTTQLAFFIPGIWWKQKRKQKRRLWVSVSCPENLFSSIIIRCKNNLLGENRTFSAEKGGSSASAKLCVYNMSIPSASERKTWKMFSPKNTRVVDYHRW